MVIALLQIFHRICHSRNFENPSIFVKVRANDKVGGFLRQWRMSVTLLQIDSSSLFLNGIEPFLASQFFVWHSTEYCSSIFDLGPVTPKIYSPKFWPKLAYNSACTADRTEMFAPTAGFSGWPIQWNHRKCCGADPCCHGIEIWAKIAYNSACPFKSILFFSVESRNFLAVGSPCGALQNDVLRFLI